MDHTYEIFLTAFATVLFCAAITWLLLLDKNYNNALKVSDKILKEDIIFEQYHEMDNGVVTRDQIIAILVSPPLDYDMEINGQLISKYDNVKLDLANYIIPDMEYKKTYAYDSSGNITRLIFTSD